MHTADLLPTEIRLLGNEKIITFKGAFTLLCNGKIKTTDVYYCIRFSYSWAGVNLSPLVLSSQNDLIILAPDDRWKNGELLEL